jgi:hypothetical protein
LTFWYLSQTGHYTRYASSIVRWAGFSAPAATPGIPPVQLVEERVQGRGGHRLGGGLRCLFVMVRCPGEEQDQVEDGRTRAGTSFMGLSFLLAMVAQIGGIFQ